MNAMTESDISEIQADLNLCRRYFKSSSYKDALVPLKHVESKINDLTEGMVLHPVHSEEEEEEVEGDGKDVDSSASSNTFLMQEYKKTSVVLWNVLCGSDSNHSDTNGENKGNGRKQKSTNIQTKSNTLSSSSHSTARVGGEDSDNGDDASLLSCIRDCIKSVSVPQQDVSEVFKFSATLLLSVLERLGVRMLTSRQVKSIHEVCWKGYKTLSQQGKYSKVQAEFLSILLMLLRKEKNHGPLTATDESYSSVFTCTLFAAEDIIENCVNLCTKPVAHTSVMCKAVALELLGAICRAFPTETCDHFRKVFRCFMYVADKIIEELNQTLGGGFFLGLKDFLMVYLLSYEQAEERESVVKIHKMTLNALADVVDSTQKVQNYVFVKAAMSFFRSHGNTTLAECVFADTTIYFHLFQKLWVHKNIEVRRESYFTATTFFQSISRQFSEISSSSHAQCTHDRRTAANKLLVSLVGELERVLADSAASSLRPQLMFAMVAYGYMARPIRCTFGEKSIQIFFNHLAGQSETLLSAFVTQRGELARLLPQLLIAFSHFLVELSTVSFSALETVKKLVETMVELFATDHYFERIRRRTASPLMQLFTALRRHSLSASLIRFFCAQVLQVVTGVIGSEVALEDNEEDGENTWQEEAAHGVEENTTNSTAPAAAAAKALVENPATVHNRIAIYAKLIQQMTSERYIFRDLYEAWLKTSEVRTTIHQVQMELQRTILLYLAPLDLTVVELHNSTVSPLANRNVQTAAEEDNVLLLSAASVASSPSYPINTTASAAASGVASSLSKVLSAEPNTLTPCNDEQYVFFLKLVNFYGEIAASLWRPAYSKQEAYSVPESIVKIEENEEEQEEKRDQRKETEIDEMQRNLSEWIIFLVERSRQYGYVSGFFRLLYVTVSRIPSHLFKKENQSTLIQGLVYALEEYLGTLCEHRLHLYMDELLYQCCTFILIGVYRLPSLSHQLPIAGLKVAFKSVLLVSTGGSEFLTKEMVGKNKDTALLILKKLTFTNPNAAAEIFSDLLQQAKSSSPVHMAQLSRLAASHGNTIANSLLLKESAACFSSASCSSNQGFLTTSHQKATLTENDLLSLPFLYSNDLKFPVYKLLDRLTHLCLYGTDDTAVTAAELFHFIVVWSVGKSNHDWYEHLFPTVIELAATSIHAVTAELFADLLEQSSHWFARNAHGHLFTAALLQKLQHSSASVRHTAAQALVGYLSWCRPGEAESRTRCPQIVTNLGALLLGDSVWGRLGGCTAIHRILKAFLRGELPCLADGDSPNENTNKGNASGGELLNLLKYVLQGLYLAQKSTPNDELGIAEELMISIQLFQVIYAPRAEGDNNSGRHSVIGIKKMEDEEEDALIATLLERAASLSELNENYTKDLVTLLKCVCYRKDSYSLEHLVASRLKKTIAQMNFIGSNPRLLKRGAGMLFLYVVLCEQRVLHPVVRETRERKRSREENDDTLFHTILSHTEKTVRMSRVEKESVGTFNVKKTDEEEEAAFCAALLHFLEFCGGGAEECIMDEKLLCHSLFSIIARQFIRGPSSLYDSNHNNEKNRRNSNVREKKRSKKEKNVGFKLLAIATNNILKHHENNENLNQLWVDSLRLVLPPFLTAQSPSHALELFLQSPFEVTCALRATATLVGLPPLSKQQGTLTLWEEVAAPTNVLKQGMRNFLEETLLLLWRKIKTTGTCSGSVAQSLFTLLFGLGASFETFLTQITYQIGKFKDEDENVDINTVFVSKDVKIENEEAEGGDEDEKDQLKRQEQQRLQRKRRDEYNLVIESFFKDFYIALEPFTLSNLCEFLHDTCVVLSSILKDELHTAKKEKETEDGEEENNNNNAVEKQKEREYEQLFRLDHGAAASALRMILTVIKNTSNDSDEDATLKINAVSSGLELILADASACTHSEAATAFLLKLVDLFFQVDTEKLLLTQSETIRDQLILLLGKVMRPEHWEGRRHTLLSSRRATRVFNLGARVLFSALKSTSECRTLVGMEESVAINKKEKMLPLAELGTKLISQIVVDEFPIDWKELPEESMKRDHYLRVVRAINMAASVLLPLCPQMLLTMLPLLGFTDLPVGDELAATMEQTLAHMNEADRWQLCDTCVSLQRSQLPPQAWWAATYRVSLPIVRSFSSETRVKFFCQQIKALVQTAEDASLTSSKRANPFVMLEAMYRLIDSQTLKTTINGAYIDKEDGGEGTELTKKLIGVCAHARLTKPNGLPGTTIATTISMAEKDNKLVLQQAAFRCLVALLMATQTNQILFVSYLLSVKNPDTLNFVVNGDWLDEYTGGCEEEVGGSSGGGLPLQADFPRVLELTAKESTDWELRYRPKLQRQLSRQMKKNKRKNRNYNDMNSFTITGAVKMIEVEKENVDWYDLETFAASPRSGHYSLLHLSSAVDGNATTTSQMPVQRRSSTVLSQLTLPQPDYIFSSPDALIDLDPVWNSSCTGILLSLVDFLIHKFDTPLAATAAPSPAKAAEPPAENLPAWAEAIGQILSSEKIHLSVKLVFVRLIQLRVSFFELYANFFAEKLLDVVTHPLLGNAVHYIAREVFVLLIEWSERGVLKFTQAAARKAIHFLLQAVPNSSTNAVGTNVSAAGVSFALSSTSLFLGWGHVLRHNIELFRALYVQVKSVFSLTASDLEQLLVVQDEKGSDKSHAASPLLFTFGCQVCGILADQGTPLATTGALGQVEEIYKCIASFMNNASTDMSLAAAEVLGMELELLHKRRGNPRSSVQNEEEEDNLVIGQQLEDKLKKLVQNGILGMKSEDNALKALRIVLSHCPVLITEFSTAQLFSNFVNVSLERKILFLDNLGADPVAGTRFYMSLHTQFSGKLDTFDNDVRVYFFELLAKLVPHLSDEHLNFLEKAFLTEKNADLISNDADYQAAFFRCAIEVLRRKMDEEQIAKKKEAPKEDTALPNKLLHLVLDKGLKSPSPFVQDKVLEFVDMHQLHPLLEERFAALLSDPLFNQDKSCWPRHSAILLLSLVSRSPRFRDTTHFFSKPLYEQAIFEPKIFSSSWQGGSLISKRGTVTAKSALLPLFSQAQSNALDLAGVMAPPRGTVFYPGASQRRQNSSSSYNTATTSAIAANTNAAYMRRPQGTLPPPQPISSSLIPASQSETALFTAHTFRASQRCLTSKLLFSRANALSSSKDGNVTLGSSLATKIRTEGTLQSHMARAARKKKTNNLMERQNYERTHKIRPIAIFRDYREGEVPDVQVSMQAFITPLQALCLHDTEIASLVWLNLVRTSLDWIETRQKEIAKEAVERGSKTHSADSSEHSPYYAQNLDAERDKQRVEDLRIALTQNLKHYVETVVMAGTLPAADSAILPLSMELSLMHAALPTNNDTNHHDDKKNGSQWSKVTEVCTRGLLSPQSTQVVSQALLLLLGNGATSTSTNTKLPLALWVNMAQVYKTLALTDLSLEASRRYMKEEDVSVLLQARRRAETGARTLCKDLLETWMESHSQETLQREYREKEKEEEETAHLGDFIFQFFDKERHEASAALLEWDAVWSEPPSSTSNIMLNSSTWAAAGLRENAQRCLKYLETQKDGGQILKRSHPFEWGALLFSNGRYRDSIDFAEAQITQLLQQQNFMEKGNREEYYRAAYRMFLLLENCETLLHMEEKRINSSDPKELERSLQGITAHVKQNIFLHPHLLEDVLWTQRTLHRDLFAPQYGIENEARAGKDALVPPELRKPLMEKLENTMCDVVRQNVTPLLTSTKHNNSLREILLVTRKHFRQMLSNRRENNAQLLTLGVCADLYKVVLNAPWSDSAEVSPHDTLREITDKISLNQNLFNETERITIERVFIRCSVLLDVHPDLRLHRRAISTVIADLQSLAPNSTSSDEDEVLPFLALLDQFLCTIRDDERLWLMFANTLIRALSLYGTSTSVLLPPSRKVMHSSVDKDDDTFTYPRANEAVITPIYCVPQLLQIFRLEAVKQLNSSLSEEWKKVLECMEKEVSLSVWQPWTAQLLSALLQEEHVTVAAILLQLAKAYPQTVYYPYSCAKEEIRKLCRSKANSTKMNEKLLSTILMELERELETGTRLESVRRFVIGLHLLGEPGVRLQMYLREIANYLKKYKETNKKEYYDAAQNVFLQFPTDIFNTTTTNKNDNSKTSRKLVMGGVVNENFAKEFEQLQEKLLDEKGCLTTNFNVLREIHDRLDAWNKRRNSEIEKKRSEVLVRDYCPELLQLHHPSFSHHDNNNDTKHKPQEEEDYDDRSEKRQKLSSAESTRHHLAEKVIQPQSSQPEPLQLPQQPLLLLDNVQTDDAIILTNNHANTIFITGIDPTMKVMASLQKPKRLTFYTSSQNVTMLLKGNEDLRLDQRVEEFFQISNALLMRRQQQIRRPLLYIRTYSVVPVSTEVGLIQWVPHTDTMSHQIQLSMMKQGVGEKNESSTTITPPTNVVLAELKNQLEQLQVNMGGRLEFFPNTRENPFCDAVTRLTARVDKQHLQSSLQLLGAQWQDYFDIQTNFVNSYATFSLVSYLLGIGDRHLNNVLIDVRNGEAVSIDFGHAFGSATRQLSIPELVPFRLTPQIRHVQGSLGDARTALVMTQVLHTLRQNRSVMEGLTACFASEPLSQWKSESAQEQEAKVRSVKRKLDLENPCGLMLDLVKENRYVQQKQKQNAKIDVFARVQGILEGQPRRRSIFGSTSATEEERRKHNTNTTTAINNEDKEADFVQCLIEMATDPNLLGHIYFGWQPLL